MSLQFATFPDIKALDSESFGTVRTVIMQGLVLVHKCPTKGSLDVDELRIEMDVSGNVVPDFGSVCELVNAFVDKTCTTEEAVALITGKLSISPVSIIRLEVEAAYVERSMGITARISFSGK